MNHLTSRADNQIILNVISSNINEAIRAILNLFIFFYKKIPHTQKAQKAQKARNYKKHKKRKKRKKRKKHKTPNKQLPSS